MPLNNFTEILENINATGVKTLLLNYFLYCLFSCTRQELNAAWSSEGDVFTTSILIVHEQMHFRPPLRPFDFFSKISNFLKNLKKRREAMNHFALFMVKMDLAVWLLLPSSAMRDGK